MVRDIRLTDYNGDGWFMFTSGMYPRSGIIYIIRGPQWNIFRYLVKRCGSLPFQPIIDFDGQMHSWGYSYPFLKKFLVKSLAHETVHQILQWMDIDIAISERSFDPYTDTLSFTFDNLKKIIFRRWAKTHHVDARTFRDKPNHILAFLACLLDEDSGLI